VSGENQAPFFRCYDRTGERALAFLVVTGVGDSPVVADSNYSADPSSDLVFDSVSSRKRQRQSRHCEMV